MTSEIEEFKEGLLKFWEEGVLLSLLYQIYDTYQQMELPESRTYTTNDVNGLSLLSRLLDNSYPYLADKEVMDYFTEALCCDTQKLLDISREEEHNRPLVVQLILLKRLQNGVGPS